MGGKINDIGKGVDKEILDQIIKAIETYDTELAKSAAKKAVEQAIDPLIVLDVMTNAIRQIGDGFAKGELWLPDLIGAASALSIATPIIQDEIAKRGMKRDPLGIVVIGTVKGDIHDIGKTMVSTLLAAEGFEVHDIGVDIDAERFVEVIKTHNAQILAMSSLMTTTMAEQRNVIQMLITKGLRDKVKVMVGGGSLTNEFAEAIGADGYRATAPEAVMLAKMLIGKYEDRGEK